MDNVMFNVRMLAAMMKTSISGLADMAEIKPQHLLDVSCGRTKMSADDIVKLSSLTGVPAKQIEH